MPGVLTDAMLLSSILQILHKYQDQAQPKIAEEAKVKMPESETVATTTGEAPGLQQIEMEIAAAASQLNPLSELPQSIATVRAGPNLEELIRAVTKFKKSEELRVVDVFE